MDVSEDSPDPHRHARQLGDRFDAAFAYASRLHRGARRRDGRTPYLAHLMGVAATVVADGGDEDAAIAALLHDAVQQPTDIPILNEIRRRFGSRVAGMVEACTDHDPAQDRPSWEVRKAAHVARLRDAEPACLRIMLADTLYVARELLHGHIAEGESVWNRYSAGRLVADHLRDLSAVFGERLTGPLVEEYERTVTALLDRTAAVPA